MGKPVIGPADHIDRLAAQAAGEIQFADAFGKRARRQHEQQRVLTDQYHHLHGLAALEIFVAVNAAVLPFRDLTADGLSVIDLVAIAAEIEPAGVRVLRDDAIGGADIARFVHLVMARHGKFQDVDLVAFQHIFEDRPVFHGAWRNVLHRLDAIVILLDDVDLALAFQRKAEGQRHALHRREMAVERAVTLRISRNLIEQQRRRRAVAVLGEHMGDGAHLGVPARAVDAHELAHFLDPIDPAAQAAIAAFDQFQTCLATCPGQAFLLRHYWK